MTTTEKFQNLKFPLRISVKIIKRDKKIICLEPKNNMVPKKYCCKEYELVYMSKGFDVKGDYLFIEIHNRIGEKNTIIENERDALSHAIQRSRQDLQKYDRDQKIYSHKIKLYSKELKLCEKKLKKLK